METGLDGMPKGDSSERNSAEEDSESTSTDMTESDSESESESDSCTSVVRSMEVLGIRDVCVGKVDEGDVHLVSGLRRSVSLTLGGGLSWSLSESVAESFVVAVAVLQLLSDLFRFCPQDGSIVLLCNILALFFSRTSLTDIPTLPFSP